MTLTLITTRCPDGVGPDRREVGRDAFTIGRGAECEWVLPDPDKILSKRHCEVAPRGEAWIVTDTSANGTLLNGTALESGLPHPLRDNDRLTLGRYDIAVRIGSVAETDLSDAPTRFAMRPAALEEKRLTGDPFAPLADDPLEAAYPDIGLPPNFDALDGSGPAEAADPFTAADNTPDLHAHFRPPRPSLDLLPDDWDLEPPKAADGAGSTSAPAAAEVQAADLALDRAPAAPVPSPSSDSAQAGYVAFVTGAGVKDASCSNAATALSALGAAFRALVSGLRQSMIARATVKSEFRIGQTMIRASGNNPLKFAADDDDALAALLGHGRARGMEPAVAVTEALRDIRLHELAVAAALQSGIRDLLAEVAPDAVMRGTREAGFGEFPGRRKQAAWDAYVARHAAVSQALSDDFDSVFGRSFARAYETASTLR